MRSSIVLGITLLATLGLTRWSDSQAQDPPSTPKVRQQGALRVFLDCPDYSCDHDFMRTEINFVSHIRERQDAQVYVLIASQETASRGIEFTAYFIGQREFDAVDDTLHYASGPADSDDEVRERLVQLLKRGLIRYANHTALGEAIRISFDSGHVSRRRPTAAARPDPWDNWTFNTTLNGSLNSEKSFTTIGLNASVLGNRTTAAWKINALLSAGYNEARIEVGEDEVLSISRNLAFNGLAVRSLGSHWAFGARATLTSSTFLNQSLALRVAPALEYNVFPYSESTRQQFTIQYSVGATSFDYAEQTIYGKTLETLLDQKLLVNLSIKQPWGSISTSLEGSSYLHDFTKRRGTLVSNMDLNLFAGFSIVVIGGLELVRDQLFLPAGGASPEEILLREQQLATSFRYWTSIGFGYTFGSPFASVVNPRFEGTSGGQAIVR